MNEEGKQMSEKALSDLRECIRISQSLFEGSMEAVREGNQDYAQEVIGVKDKLRCV